MKDQTPGNISSNSEDDSDSLNDSESEDELDNAQDSTTNIPKQSVKSIASNKHLLELKDTLGIFYEIHNVSIVAKAKKLAPLISFILKYMDLEIFQI